MSRRRPDMAALAFGLVFVAAALWWLRRRGAVNFRGGRGPRVMEVIESRGLAPGHTLHLVRVADRVMALATHSAGCTLLEVRPWTELQKSIPPEVRS